MECNNNSIANSNVTIALQVFKPELECQYTAQNKELISEITINVINKLYENPEQGSSQGQGVRVTIRTFNKDFFKSILEKNKICLNSSQKPYFWTYNLKLDPIGNFDTKELNNRECPLPGFTIISSQLKLSNADCLEHIMQVLNCLAQLDHSVNEVAQSFFTTITENESKWLKNCMTICKNGLYDSNPFAQLPKENTTYILNLAIASNGNLYGKHATELLNRVLLPSKKFSLTNLIANDK